jgi:hypothetical protein
VLVDVSFVVYALSTATWCDRKSPVINWSMFSGLLYDTFKAAMKGLVSGAGHLCSSTNR